MNKGDEISVVEHEEFWYVKLTYGITKNLHKTGKKFDGKPEAIMYAHDLEQQKETELGVKIYSKNGK